MTTYNSGNAVGLNALKGYFNNLVAATTNKKTCLEQLVNNNAKLVATNEELVAVVEKLTNDNKNLQ